MADNHLGKFVLARRITAVESSAPDPNELEFVRVDDIHFVFILGAVVASRHGEMDIVAQWARTPLIDKLGLVGQRVYIRTANALYASQERSLVALLTQLPSSFEKLTQSLAANLNACKGVAWLRNNDRYELRLIYSIQDGGPGAMEESAWVSRKFAPTIRRRLKLPARRRTELLVLG